MEIRKTQILTEGGFSYPPSLNSRGGQESPPSVSCAISFGKLNFKITGKMPVIHLVG
jgi:hypothetical protein